MPPEVSQFTIVGYPIYKEQILNYTDFGVTCAEELEQDKWSLTRPTFKTPGGGVLAVVGMAGKQKGGVKCYVVHCSECGKDRELCGDGVFTSTKGNLARGVLPCGCSLKPQWSEGQYRVRIRRLAEKKKYIFSGWAEHFKGVETRCRLICPDHGEWESTSMFSFLRGTGCPLCGIREHLTRETFIEKSVQKHGGMYDYSSVREVVNNKHKVEIICRKHGSFNQQVSSHLRGEGCPLCGKETSGTKRKEESLFIEEANKKHNYLYDYSKVRYRGAHRRVEIICKRHGTFSQNPNNHLQGRGCPSCAGHAQRQAYIHTVWDMDVVLAIKLGIAKDWTDRLKDLSRKSVLDLRNVGVWGFKTARSCKAAERECKQTLKTGVLSAREMKDGWTETVSVLDLDKVIAIYEKHGGVRIN